MFPVNSKGSLHSCDQPGKDEEQHARMNLPVQSTSESVRALIFANRILAHEGVLDAFGHVSLRDPEDPTRFIIPRSVGPELVASDDLQTWTVATNQQVGGDPRAGYAERAIHAAVYAARPDVFAICHNHAPSVIPFGTTGLPLRPIFHMAGLLGTNVPLWDPQAEFGDTDLLVRTLVQGASLARTLGPERVALMRGHGALVAGATLKEVVLCSVYLEHNARLQWQALTLGHSITYLTDGEIAATLSWQLDPLIQDRAWDTWAARIAADIIH
jgi:ribulose-5-phosphate 4-epimerase/fuculose-1-phosphate aldolase